MFKRKSVLFNWLISYLVFLILFVIVTTVIYSETKNIVSNQIDTSNTFQLKRTRISIDNIINDTRNIGLQFVYNTRVQPFINISGKLSDTQYFNTYAIVNDLKMYKATNMLIDNIIIYLKNIDLVITANGATDIKNYYRSEYTRDEAAYKKWMEEFSEKIGEKYSVFDYMDENNLRHRKIAYIRGLSTTNPTDLASSVIVTIDQSKFFSEMEPNESINQTMFIIDKNDKMVAFSAGEPKTGEISYDRMAESMGAIRTKIDTKNVVVSYITSQVNKWKYVSIVPEEIYLDKLKYVRNAAFIGMLVTLLAGTGLMYFFMKKNYNPITKLLGIFKEHSDLDLENTINEYSIIENAINKTLHEKKVMDYELYKQKAILKKRFLEKLLKGQIHEKTMLYENFQSFGMKFLSNYFVVMLFFIEEYNDENDIAEGNNFYNYDQVQFILTNVIEELVETHHKGFMVDADENMMACIVSIESERIVDIKDDMLTVVLTAQKFIENQFHIQFTVSMSDVCDKIEDITIAYSEAVEVLKHKQVLGIDQMLCYEDIRDLSQSKYYYPLHKEQQLINSIKAGNYNDASLIAEELFSKNFMNKRGLTVDLAQCLMLNLTTTMIRVVNEISGDFGEDLPDELNPMEQLLPCKNIDEMKSRLDVFLQKLCSRVTQINNDNSNWIRKDLIPYIDIYYLDFNLNVSEIAQHFNVHPVYLSRLFKEKMGEGILDYINKIRIEKAKMLLKEKKMNIDDVAIKVGYSNVRTFSRIFKKVEGITPGKFKEIEF